MPNSSGSTSSPAARSFPFGVTCTKGTRNGALKEGGRYIVLAEVIKGRNHRGAVSGYILGRNVKVGGSLVTVPMYPSVWAKNRFNG